MKTRIRIKARVANSPPEVFSYCVDEIMAIEIKIKNSISNFYLLNPFK